MSRKSHIKSLAFNNPVLCTNQSLDNQGSLEPTEKPLATHSSSIDDLPVTEVLMPKITSDHHNVIISSLKPSEWVSKDSEEYEEDAAYDYEDYFLPESPVDWVWDKKTLIIRAYECGGAIISTTIRLHYIPETMEITAEEIDLLEYKIGNKLEVIRNSANNTVVIHTEFTPFEIKSIRVTLK